MVSDTDKAHDGREEGDKDENCGFVCACVCTRCRSNLNAP